MTKYRMYSLVLRQLNPMQKGVQAAHSMMDYAFKFHKKTEFIQWANVDKTIITLDGGTYPEMKECRNFLDEMKIPYTTFYEEDLNNIMTSISFILDDKVWDTKTYPTPEHMEDLMSGESLWSGESELLNDEKEIRNLKIRNFIFSKRLSQ